MPDPIPFTAQELQARFSQMRQGGLDRFLNRSFPRKLFESPLSTGRFDVEYLPRAKKLNIYLKVFYNFIDSTVDDSLISKPLKGDDPTWYRKTWTDTEKNDWKAAFKRTSEQVWNGARVQFRCIRPGWEDVTCVPQLIIEEAGTAATAHYEVKVEKTVLRAQEKDFPVQLKANQHVGAGYTRVHGRKEEFTPNSEKKLMRTEAVKLEGRAFVSPNFDKTTGAHVATPVASLNQMDVEERVGSKACGGHLNAIAIENFATASVDHDRNQLVRALADSNASTLRFFKHTKDMTPDSLQRLGVFAQRVKQFYANPSMEAMVRRIALDLAIATDKNESSDLQAKRRKAVEDKLVELGVTNPVRTKSTSTHHAWKDRPVHGAPLMAGGKKWVDSVTMTIQDRSEIEKTYAANFKYMTVPHEVGHMLGLMDEYAPTEDELLVKLMGDAGVISKQNASAVVCNRNKDFDRLWARLLIQFELGAPVHNVKVGGKSVHYSADRRNELNYQAATTSLMSAGFNVAPQHFVIIGLALQEYTEPYTTWDLERQFARGPDDAKPGEFISEAFAKTKRKFMWRIEKM